MLLIVGLTACVGSPEGTEADLAVDAGISDATARPDEGAVVANVLDVGLDAQGAVVANVLDVGSDALKADAAESVDAAGIEQTPVVDPGCAENGCLLDAILVGAVGYADLRAFLPPTIEIDNGYRVWRIHYVTDGREARASVTIPIDVEPPEGGVPIAINNPGTVGIADHCAMGSSEYGTALAGYFGARGFAAAAVDYPGLGTPGMHPYLVAEVEGRASLDCARALKNLLLIEGIETSGQVVAAGTSQGGHASIAMAAEHALYAPDVDLRAVAAGAPASLFLEHWSSGVRFDGAHLVAHALLVWTYAAFYGHAGGGLFHAEIAPNIGQLLEEHCFFLGSPTLADVIPHDAADLFDPDFLSAFRRGDLSAYPALEEGFSRNRLSGYVQTAPLRIYQGVDDEAVLMAGTQALVAALRADGVELSYEEIAGAGHADLAFGFLGVPQVQTAEVMAWMRSHLSAP